MLGNKELCVVTQSGELRPSDSEVPAGTAEYAALVQQLLRWAGGSARPRPGRARLPGAQPISMGRAELPAVGRGGHLVALKSDGVRQVLLLTRLDGEPRAVMVDRRMRVFDVEVWANDSFFDGTALDGELIWQYSAGSPDRLVFLVFDMVAVRGRSLLEQSYSARISAAHSAILTAVPCDLPPDALDRFVADEDKIFFANNTHDLQLRPKRVLPAACVADVWEQRHTVGHFNDGLVFTPDAPAGGGGGGPVIKWKTDHTVDLLFEFAAGGGLAPARMLLCERDQLVPCDRIHLPPHGWLELRPVPNELVQILVQRADGPFAALLECLCHIHLDAGRVDLSPSRRRDDKDTPNSLRTAVATMRSALEAVRLDEIVAACERQW